MLERSIFAAAVAALTLSACGGGGGGGTSTNYDGSWSGTTSTAGTITFTVSHNKITAYSVGTGASPFGRACSQQGATNQASRANIAITDGRFSWGGAGKGYPVKGTFGSATSASGTAEFAPDLVLGKVPKGCAAKKTATWKATKAGQ